MAWRCGGSTNTELIQNLFSAGLITSPRVRDAMLLVDRAHFLPPSSSSSSTSSSTTAYADAPQPIGHAATISAPHMHAAAAEALLPFLRPGGRVLDVGSGSGYLTLVFGALVGARGRVVGLEHVPELAEGARRNVARSELGRELLGSGAVGFSVGDGRVGVVEREAGKGGEGGEEEEEDKGWDAIHVGAAAGEGVDEVLVRQLKRPGRLFIPVEGADGQQWIWIVDKDEQGRVSRRRDMGVRYVPLTDRPAP